MAEEEAISIGATIGDCVQFTAGALPIAERELAAFARAVTELFGAEQTRQAVEDWMKELELSDWPAGWSALDFRQVTIASATRVAKRMNLEYQRSEEFICHCIWGIRHLKIAIKSEETSI